MLNCDILLIIIIFKPFIDVCAVAHRRLKGGSHEKNTGCCRSFTYDFFFCLRSVAARGLHTASSHRVHVNPSHPVHTPTGNRVRMTPTHGQIGPVGGRMSSTAHRHVGQPPVYRKVGPSPGPHYDHVYVRPSLISYRYYRPLPPPRWRYVSYYGRPYSVWYGYPVAYYGYPYGVYYGRYYATPGVSISVRI